ncbi:MAG: hypothetical protein PHE43_00985 [Candidatus Nanoarchaeia archaeon]|nr:hypothetical protein [Candidatus Nanoarchaeia archaeon]
MKKIIFIIIIFLLLTTTIFGKGFGFDMSFGYFFGEFNEIDSDFVWGAGGSYSIDDTLTLNISIIRSANEIREPENKEIKIDYFLFGATIQLSKIIFIGGGISYTSLREKTESGTLDDMGFGGFIETGARYLIDEDINNITVGGRVMYSYNKVEDENIGGIFLIFTIGF